MALKTFVTDINEVETAHQGLYIQSGDGWRLDADYEDVSGLKSALVKERANAKTLRQKLGKFKDIDVDRYEELVGVEDANLSSNDAYKRAKSRWQREKQLLENELHQRDAHLKNQVLTSKLTDTALQSGVNPEDVDDVLKLTKNHFEIDEDGNVAVNDETGEPSGITVEKFFGEVYKEQKPKFYSGLNRSGAGSNPLLQKNASPLNIESQINKAIQDGDVAKSIELKSLKYDKQKTK